MQRLLRRLTVDQVLRDPLIVGRLPAVDGLVLLDGTNRQAALRRMGCQRLLVQVVDYADRHCVQLRTWAHAVSKPLDAIISGVQAAGGMEVVEIDQMAIDEALDGPGALAALSHDGRAWLVQRDSPRADRRHPSRPVLLRQLVELYESDMTRVSRDEEPVGEILRQVAEPTGGGSDTALVTFPRLSRTQVAALSVHGTLIPSGITRHVLRCGRALRVNLPLQILNADQTLESSEARLARHLEASTPRRYLEPTILFDS